MWSELPIVRLQVQRNPIKPGKAPLRWYDASQITVVDRLDVGPRGVHGTTADDESIIDVHHQDHPQSRDRKGKSGVLFMATGDYRALRDRYGDHVVDGVAGETILVDLPSGLAGRDLPDTARVHTPGGVIDLEQVRVAEPCVEFSRFCLRLPMSTEVGEEVRRTMLELGGGARGYRAVAAAGSIHLGDRLSLG